MNRFTLFTFILVSFQSLSQEIKKKNLGLYEGYIPAYSILSDTSVFEVSGVSIQLNLQSNFIEYKLDKLARSGDYQVISKNKKQYIIDVYFEKENESDRLLLDEKSKSIIREGFPPQPEVTLLKVKK